MTGYLGNIEPSRVLYFPSDKKYCPWHMTYGKVAVYTASSDANRALIYGNSLFAPMTDGVSGVVGTGIILLDMQSLCRWNGTFAKFIYLERLHQSCLPTIGV